MGMEGSPDLPHAAVLAGSHRPHALRPVRPQPVRGGGLAPASQRDEPRRPSGCGSRMCRPAWPTRAASRGCSSSTKTSSTSGAPELRRMAAFIGVRSAAEDPRVQRGGGRVPREGAVPPSHVDRGSGRRPADLVCHQGPLPGRSRACAPRDGAGGTIRPRSNRSQRPQDPGPARRSSARDLGPNGRDRAPSDTPRTAKRGPGRHHRAS